MVNNFHALIILLHFPLQLSSVSCWKIFQVKHCAILIFLDYLIFQDVIFPSGLNNRVWNWSGKKRLPGLANKAIQFENRRERRQNINGGIYLTFYSYWLFIHGSPLPLFLHKLLFSHRTKHIYSSIISYFLPYAPYITNNHQNLVAMSL